MPARPLASFAALSVLLVACVGSDARTRFGGAYGLQRSTFSFDRVEPVEMQPSLLDVDAQRGFAEAAFEGDESVVSLRLLGGRDRHPVEGSTASVAVEQGLLLSLFSRRYPICDGLEFRPLGGVGVGFTDVDADPLRGFDAPDWGPSFAVAAGAELQIADHLMVGGMGWGGLFGYPGETEGSFGAGMLYMGVRF